MDSHLNLRRQLTRNAAFNLVGQVWVALLLLMLAPVLVHGLGDQLFGVVVLAWAFLGYFTYFDLGLSQATVKFMAEHLARNDRVAAARTLWMALLVNLGVGLLCGLALAAASPILSSRVFHVPPDSRHDATVAFMMVSAALPFVLVQGMLRGVPSALQRFDLINLVNITASTVQWGAAVLLVHHGVGVRGVIASTVAVRVASTLVYGMLVLRLLPEVVTPGRWSFSGVRRFVAFSGWLAVSQYLTALLLYADRLLIASLRSVAAVTYYAVPSEAIARLWIIPGSLSPTLFPAFTDQSVAGRRSVVSEMYVRSVRYVLLLVGPIAIVLGLYAGDLLSLWMGRAFADQSTLVLQILVVGMLANCLAFVPDVAVKGLGRPDLVAKLQLVEVPIYLAVAWLMIREHGIYGAAAVWTARMISDAAGLFFLGNRAVGLSMTHFLSDRLFLSGVGCLLVLAVLLRSLRGLGSAAPLQLCVVAAAIVAYAALIWSSSLDPSERGVITRMSRSIVRAARAGVSS